jgi:DNA-binding MarR family transcriptional regulator
MNPVPKPADFYRPDGWRPEESVGLLIKRVMQSILLQADRRLAEHGLTHAQWVPLFKLQGGCETVAALSRETQTDAGGMTRALDRLEAKGLVRRVRSSEDRRVINLELTDEGKRSAGLVPPVLAEVLNAHLAGFSHAEWHTLMALLERMVVNGDAMRELDKAADKPSE